MNPQLPPNEVHVWWAYLDLPASRLRNLEETLARDEQARSERFRFERDRNRFIAARGILREILGHYLAMEPHTIRFDYGRHGKPRLADQCAHGGIEFSVSHSEGIALYGICRDQQIGVDVQYIQDFPEMDLVAEDVFSKIEKESLDGLTGSNKNRAFYKHWTRREALGKALGQGLALMEDTISVVDATIFSSLSHGSLAKSEALFNLLLIDLPVVSGWSAAAAIITGTKIKPI